MARDVPSIRVRQINDRESRPDSDYVLYWMIANRRAHDNFALQHAANLARQWNVGLVVLEALRAGYKWASPRIHTFVLQGMKDNQTALSDRVHYYPYVEPKPGAGSGLLESLASNACAVVTDDFPCFFLPRMVEHAGKMLPVSLVAVDSNGLYPMRATDRVFTTAASFRRHLQKELPPHLGDVPAKDPLGRRGFKAVTIPAALRKQWRPGVPDTLPTLELDVPAVGTRGGSTAARKALQRFLGWKLDMYATDRNQPDADAQSHLSPYLHFGHISAHEIFRKLTERVGWTPERLALKPTGSREGWWGAGPAAESFLDEFVTWREIGYNRCANQQNYASFTSLPSWAQETLRIHESDPRPHTYTLRQFENAETYDPIWNAAQRQLVREGTIHNYLRMLWGKKILEWSKTPRQALKVMLELNNKYALDGRNPNSYSGIFWILGRYDRAWGPERPIFGKVRYMSSDSTARKLKLKGYLERHGQPS